MKLLLLLAENGEILHFILIYFKNGKRIVWKKGFRESSFYGKIKVIDVRPFTPLEFDYPVWEERLSWVRGFVG
jgi:hypothetical protein